MRAIVLAIALIGLTASVAFSEHAAPVRPAEACYQIDARQ
jgi:hypothetical protein